jgi:hypothetical protein
MAKATLTLSTGAIVTLEGTPEEVHRLLELHSEGPDASGVARRDKRKSAKVAKETRRVEPVQPAHAPDLNEIVNLVKNCDEAEAIEKNILDRASTVDRVLLPLYVVHEHQANELGLTSGEISKITTELGVRVTQPNASMALADSASRYVMGDKVRKKGQPVRYRLSRRGLQYLNSVIGGTGDGH